MSVDKRQNKSAPLVFHAKASHSWKTKIVVLAEELRRRLRNADSRHTLKDLLVIVRTFLQKMADSGYDPGTRSEVVRLAVRKHYRDLHTAKKEGSSIYHSRERSIRRNE